jgi:hypothetical protein
MFTASPEQRTALRGGGARPPSGPGRLQGPRRGGSGGRGEVESDGAASDASDPSKGMRRESVRGHLPAVVGHETP